jgi:uncharacterized membrane protein YdjX (TVP38/TMEM64 family)
MDAFLAQITFYVDLYGTWMVILIGALHPFIAFPAHIFILTVSIQVLGPVQGYIMLFIGNMIGILIFYPVLKTVQVNNHSKVDNTFINQVFSWIRNEALWKHAVVIGAPLIPTQPIKYFLPLSGIGFKKYIVIFLSSYVILFISNSLLYFGVLSFFTNEIPTYLGIVFISLFVFFIYFGKNIFEKVKK